MSQQIIAPALTPRPATMPKTDVETTKRGLLQRVFDALCQYGKDTAPQDVTSFKGLL